jgi:hypothetical protein
MSAGQGGDPGIGWTSIGSPRANFACPMGIRHHASARMSRLMAPAPRLPGVATTPKLACAPDGEVRDTGTQSSTSGGDVQSQPSRARCRA